MSFSFYATGSVAAVRAKCDQNESHESVHSIATKKYVKDLLDGAPDDLIVSVEAGGHHDYGSAPMYQSGTVDLRFRITRPLAEPTTTVTVA